MSAQIIAALKLAMEICDAVPSRAQDSADSTLARLGWLVNFREDGFHGYAIIRDTLESVESVLPNAAAWCRESGLNVPEHWPDTSQRTPTPTNSAEALPNEEIRTLMHNYSRMIQPGYYSDTEFDCLQDVIAFVRAAILADRTARAATVKSVGEDAKFAEILATVIHLQRHGNTLTKLKTADEWTGKLITHIDSLLAARPSAAVSVPEGMVLVPTKPTRDMLNNSDLNVGEYLASVVWKTMLAHAPAAPPLPEAAKAEPVAEVVSDESAGMYDALPKGTLLYATSPPQAEPVSTAGAVDGWKQIVANVLMYYDKGMWDAKTAMYKLRRSWDDTEDTLPAVTAPDMSARDASRALYTPESWEVRDQVLEEVANHLWAAQWTKAAECVRALRSQPKGEAQ